MKEFEHLFGGLEDDIRRWVRDSIGQRAGGLSPEELGGLAIGAAALAGLAWLLAARIVPVVRERAVAALPWLVAACVVAVAASVVLSAVRWRSRSRPGRLVELQAAANAVLDHDAWRGLYRSLYGIVSPWWKDWLFGQSWIVFEFFGAEGRASARCWFPEELEGMVTALLRTAVPNLRITAPRDGTPSPMPAARARLKLWRDSVWPIGRSARDSLGPVTRGLASVPGGVVQVAIAPDTRWQRAALRRVRRRPEASERARGAPAPPISKSGGLGYRTEIRLRVCAPTAGLARRHLQTIASAFRAPDGPNGLRSQRVLRRRRFDRALAHRERPRPGSPVLGPDELATVFHLPVPGGGLEVAPVHLPPVQLPAAGGKVLCLADDEERTPVSLSQSDAGHHMHVLGPTGTGKSTLLLNLALDDCAAGHGFCVIDPKGDLIRDLLERIPREEWDRVVVIDPSIREHPVGLNAIECHDPEMRELVADQVVTIFRRIFERFWGPRADDALRAAILTLLHERDATICEVPLLLLKPEIWRDLIDAVDDPIGLGPWWEQYLETTEAQRVQLTGSLLYKLRAVLLRRTVRNIFGQPRSTVDLADVMDERGILLVSLAKGLLGEETSRLLGALLVARIWQAALARAARPEHLRPDFTVYADEFWAYLHLPQSLGEVLVEARGYHLPLVLTNQHLGQLASPIREALSSNARTRMAFQLGQEDARYMAREMEPLTDYDLRHLQIHQVALRLCVGARTTRPMTGVTRRPPPSLGAAHARALIQRAVMRYGRPRAVVEEEMTRRLRGRGFTGGAAEF